jgi:hypothetical protein
MTHDPLLTAIETELLTARRENSRLRGENEALRKALIQRRARVTPAAAPEPVKASPVVAEGTKPIEEWGARDFLAYFQQLHKQHYGVDYHFSRQIYEAALTQLKGVRQRLSLENETIKDIFDYHFANTFNRRFTPSVAYLCGTAGMNRYNAGRSTKGGAKDSGYTRKALESQEKWHAGVQPARPEADAALNAKLKSLGRRS